MASSAICCIILLVLSVAANPSSLPVKLEVKSSLKSRSANIHLSGTHASVYPFTVSYGACHASAKQHEAHHEITTVKSSGADRLVWNLPDDISADGCLSAWSPEGQLIGRSKHLVVQKESRGWSNKRSLDHRRRFDKRAVIPMTNASGIDAEGPWFDGVEALKQAEISTVDAKKAKAKSIVPSQKPSQTILILCVQALL